MTDLKPCPFCGSECLYITDEEDVDHTTVPKIFCNQCKTIVGVENDSPFLDDKRTYDYVMNKLIENWNRRAE